MIQPLNYLKETASQTAGPYVHIGLLPRQAGFDIFANNLGEVMVGPKTKGERVSIEGRVIDGAGAPLKDALIEIWQANAAVATITPPTGRRSRSTMIFAAGGARAAISKAAAIAFAPSSPVPSLAAVVIGPWHRTSIYGSRREASTSGSAHACTSAMRKRPMLPIRCSISSNRPPGERP